MWVADMDFKTAPAIQGTIIISDTELREKIAQGFRSDRIGEANSFSIEATAEAFTQGEEWLDGLRRLKQGIYDYINYKKEVS